uniref:Uncharacterized protein n=1 Tax=Knipowitschia caucasica TaxID=637954 RepID=A0AAV2MJN4_KNICA
MPGDLGKATGQRGTANRRQGHARHRQTVCARQQTTRNEQHRTCRGAPRRGPADQLAEEESSGDTRTTAGAGTWKRSRPRAARLRTAGPRARATREQKRPLQNNACICEQVR